MKKRALIVGLAFLAGVPLFAESSFEDRFGTRLNGLFGAKFGDRVPSSAPVIPSGDGTLLTPLDPKRPEFSFQGYFAYILPQTRAIVGFCGADVFSGNEEDKCNEAYARKRKAIEDRFNKKMRTFPPSKSGVGNSMSVLCNCGVELPGPLWAMLQVTKDISGEYSLRFIALDIKACRGAVEDSRERAKNLPPLNSLFGRTLGETVAVSENEMTLANGMCIQVFEPEKKFLDFETYVVHVLPKSRKISAIVAVNNFKDRFDASECFTKVCQLLEIKFGQKLTDTSGQFDASKPDEDGELTIKAFVMSFPESSRFIEVDLLKDVDENVFRIRISASDLLLAGALESEKRSTTGRKSDDAAALDAL